MSGAPSLTLSTDTPHRRPLKSRAHPLARRTAAWLARQGVSPNAISIFSLLFAGAGAAALAGSNSPWALALCALCIQLRLACNLLDGMVAIEGGRQTPIGALYNELPDRIADALLIVALGYAIGMAALGWFGALAAVMTAYLRALGGALGLGQDFRGPMAKPQRMATLTLAALGAALETVLTGTDYCLTIAAWVIALGSVWTCFSRTIALARQLDTD